MNATRHRRIRLPGLLLALALNSHDAWAQICLVATSSPVFTSYQSSTLASTGSVTVTCTVLGVIGLNVSYSVQMGFSALASGTQRRMGWNGNYLRYNFFCNGSYGQPWGNGNNATCVATGGQNALIGVLINSYTVYAQIPGAQFVQPGTYTDTVPVNVLY
jgi:spore coat protein U-like protein